ncbi:hypothetical protein [Candidatus Leptofilum sp.]|uniref:hypothetical protein n=1 Tax=Candidatus Leptofilum sp. TaxID=3241576 RepID=UPI003B5B9E62
MSVIEFRAKVKNGLIEIPKKYRARLARKAGKEKVRVIVLPDEPEGLVDTEAEIDMIEQLLANPLQIPDFEPISRNDLYDRF